MIGMDLVLLASQMQYALEQDIILQAVLFPCGYWFDRQAFSMEKYPTNSIKNIYIMYIQWNF